MVFCSSCGASVPEAAQFCRACGAKQEGGPSPAPPSAPAAPPAASPKAKPAGVIVVAVFLILFGLGAVLTLAVDGYNFSTYGWTPWVALNLALALYLTPADFVMAVGLLMGRRWGWKLTVASLLALVALSLPALFSGFPSTASAALVQIAIALPIFFYLARSKRVRAHFGAESVWTWAGGYGAALKREARKREARMQ